MMNRARFRRKAAGGNERGKPSVSTKGRSSGKGISPSTQKVLGEMRDRIHAANEPLGAELSAAIAAETPNGELPNQRTTGALFRLMADCAGVPSPEDQEYIGIHADGSPAHGEYSEAARGFARTVLVIVAAPAGIVEGLKQFEQDLQARRKHFVDKLMESFGPTDSPESGHDEDCTCGNHKTSRAVYMKMRRRIVDQADELAVRVGEALEAEPPTGMWTAEITAAVLLLMADCCGERGIPSALCRTMKINPDGTPVGDEYDDLARGGAGEIIGVVLNGDGVDAGMAEINRRAKEAREESPAAPQDGADRLGTRAWAEAVQRSRLGPHGDRAWINEDGDTRVAPILGRTPYVLLRLTETGMTIAAGGQSLGGHPAEDWTPQKMVEFAASTAEVWSTVELGGECLAEVERTPEGEFRVHDVMRTSDAKVTDDALKDLLRDEGGKLPDPPAQRQPGGDDGDGAPGDRSPSE